MRITPASNSKRAGLPRAPTGHAEGADLVVIEQDVLRVEIHRAAAVVEPAELGEVEREVCKRGGADFTGPIDIDGGIAQQR